MAVDTITGLDHLEGKTVGVLGAATCRRSRSTDGEITITPAVVVQVGLPYVSDFETLEINHRAAWRRCGRNKVVKEVGILVQDLALDPASALMPITLTRSRRARPRATSRRRTC